LHLLQFFVTGPSKEDNPEPITCSDGNEKTPAYHIESELNVACISDNIFVYFPYLINQKLKTMPTVIQHFIWYFISFPDKVLSNSQDAIVVLACMNDHADMTRAMRLMVPLVVE
jgi:hypothetical protein